MKEVKKTVFILAGLVFLAAAFTDCIYGPGTAIGLYSWTLSELEKNAPDAEPGRHCGDFIVVDLITSEEEDYLDSDSFARISAAVKSNKQQHPFDIEMNCCFKSEEIHEIPAGAFKNCANLYHLCLNFVNQITDIGTGAFEGCSKLECIWLPESVTSIESCAFKNCSKLEEVYIGHSKLDLTDPICTVAPDAFEGCPLMQ